jgi:cell wall-associated NlpC family hydrolase
VTRALAAFAASAVLLPVLVVAVVAAGVAASSQTTGAPSAYALADIPADYLALYRAAAATCPGMSWALLAAVGKVESDHGHNASASSAGAEGPMQFLPSTFAAYAVDGDGDGVRDINNPADAIYSAANYLCHNGGGGDAEAVRRAIYAYNHAGWYVDEVEAYMASYTDLSRVQLASATAGAPSQAASTAVGWALSQLGKPYLFGGCGPDAWDCSCLVQRAYAAAGIAIPRVTADQYSGSGPHVDRSQLAAGDLVFFGTASNIHHVGMYLGNGEMVDAPHTGTVVRVEPLHADYLGATRPSAGSG